MKRPKDDRAGFVTVLAEEEKTFALITAAIKQHQRSSSTQRSAITHGLALAPPTHKGPIIPPSSVRLIQNLPTLVLLPLR